MPGPPSPAGKSDILTRWLKAVREWKWKLSGLLRASHKAQNWNGIVSIEFSWLKQMARPAQVQGEEKWCHFLLGGMCMQEGEEWLGASLQIIYHTPYSAHPVDPIVCLLVWKSYYNWVKRVGWYSWPSIPNLNCLNINRITAYAYYDQRHICLYHCLSQYYMIKA